MELKLVKTPENERLVENFNNSLVELIHFANRINYYSQQKVGLQNQYLELAKERDLLKRNLETTKKQLVEFNESKKYYQTLISKRGDLVEFVQFLEEKIADCENEITHIEAVLEKCEGLIESNKKSIQDNEESLKTESRRFAEEMVKFRARSIELQECCDLDLYSEFITSIIEKPMLSGSQIHIYDFKLTFEGNEDIKNSYENE